MPLNPFDYFYNGNNQLRKANRDYYFKDKYHFQAEEIEHENKVQ